MVAVVKDGLRLAVCPLVVQVEVHHEFTIGVCNQCAAVIASTRPCCGAQPGSSLAGRATTVEILRHYDDVLACQIEISCEFQAVVCVVLKRQLERCFSRLELEVQRGRA